MKQYFPHYRVIEPEITMPLSRYEQHNRPYEEHNNPYHYSPNQPFQYPYSQQQYNEMEGYSLLNKIVGYDQIKDLLQSKLSGMIAPMMENIIQKVATSIAVKLTVELEGKMKNTIKDSATELTNSHAKQTQELINSHTEHINALTEFTKSSTNTPSDALTAQTLGDSGSYSSTHHSTDLWHY